MIHKDKIIEVLSEVEHGQWTVWAKAMIQQKQVTPEKKKEWEALFIPYKDLDERAKEHDRHFARKVYDKLEQIFKLS